MKYNELKEFANLKGISMKHLAEVTEFTYHGLKKAIDNDRVKLSDWMKIAKVLEMDIDAFVSAKDAALVKGEGHPDFEKVIANYERQIKFYEVQVEKLNHLIMEKEVMYQKIINSHVELIKTLTKER